MAEQNGPARTVLYDGGCGLCSRVVEVLRRLDRRRRVAFLDVNADWETIAPRYPQLSREACLRDIHIVDRNGRIRTGFAAYRSLAWVLPAAWFAIPFLYIPGVPIIGQRVYRYIADHRGRDTCALPQGGTPARPETSRRGSTPQK